MRYEQWKDVRADEKLYAQRQDNLVLSQSHNFVTPSPPACHVAHVKIHSGLNLYYEHVLEVCPMSGSFQWIRLRLGGPSTGQLPDRLEPTEHYASPDGSLTYLWRGNVPGFILARWVTALEGRVAVTFCYFRTYLQLPR